MKTIATVSVAVVLSSSCIILFSKASDEGEGDKEGGDEPVALAAVVVVVVVVIKVQHVGASTDVQIVPAQSVFAWLLSYM